MTAFFLFSFSSVVVVPCLFLCSKNFFPFFGETFFLLIFPSFPSSKSTSSPSTSLVDFFFCWYLLLAADAKQFNIHISQCHLKVLRKMVSAWHSLFPFTFSWCFFHLLHFFCYWCWLLFLYPRCIFVALTAFCLLVVAFVEWDRYAFLIYGFIKNLSRNSRYFWVGDDFFEFEMNFCNQYWIFKAVRPFHRKYYRKPA